MSGRESKPGKRLARCETKSEPTCDEDSKIGEPEVPKVEVPKAPELSDDVGVSEPSGGNVGMLSGVPAL